MTFLGGLFLPALALASLPVAIHLLTRKPPRTQPWGAMQFLLGATRHAPRRFLQLHQILLLLLRVLAVASLVLAFARPLLPGGADTGQPEEVVLVLDHSLSTGRRLADGQSALDAQIAVAQRLVGQLGDGNHLRILLSGDMPRWLIDSQTLASDNRPAIAAKLRDLKPGLGGSDLSQALAAVLQRKPAPECWRRRVVILSDDTELAWRLGDHARWQALSRAAQQTATRLQILQPPPAPADSLGNLSIDRLALEQEFIGPGEELLVRAEISNHGKSPSHPLSLRWRQDGAPTGQTQVDPIPAGGAATAEFRLPPAQAGHHLLSAKLEQDDLLSLDNELAVAANTAGPLPVLVVDDSPDRRASGFFLAAIQPPFEATTVAAQELSRTDLAPYRAIFLATPESVQAEGADHLARQVAAGVGLWIALNERIPARSFRLLQGFGGAGLCSVDLENEVQAPSLGWRVVAPDKPDPAVALVADGKRLDLAKARIHRHWAVREPLPADVRALLRLETQAPVLLDQAFGRGRVLLQTMPMNRAASNLPALHCFVPFVNECLWHLAAPTLQRRNLQPGEIFQIATEAPGQALTVTMPDGRRRDSQRSLGRLAFAETHSPGVYRFEGGGERQGFFVVARDPAESNLQPLSPESLRRLKELGFESETEGRREAPGESRPLRPVSAPLLWLAFALFLAEALTAFWLTRRRAFFSPIKAQ
jgi:hypothetical protein